MVDKDIAWVPLEEKDETSENDDADDAEDSEESNNGEDEVKRLSNNHKKIIINLKYILYL